MKQVEVLPASKRLKQVLREHKGPWFEVMRLRIMAFNNEIGVLVRNEAGTHERWVREEEVR